MHFAILRVHKDEQSYNRHWMSVERLEMGGVTALFKTDIEGQIVHKARNELTQLCVDGPEWDTAFMVDDDMVYPPHALTRAAEVLNAHPEVGIMTGVYFEKRFPHTPQLYEEAIEGEYRGKYWPILDYRERATSDGLIEVEACGAGFLFVRRSVITAMKRPWFMFLDRLGEDFYFCRKARTQGHKIWCDTTLQAIHLGVVEVHEGVFQQIRPHLKRALTPVDDHGPSRGDILVEGVTM